MALLPSITAYFSVVTSISGILQAPVPPELPPPTVISSDATSDSSVLDSRASVNALLTGQGRNDSLGSATSTSSIVNGIDIASHQHNKGADMDINKVINSQEVQFFFIKATEGTHYINPHFREDAVEVINSDTPVGFYHYARPTDDPGNAKRQAQLFVSVTGLDKDVKSIAPILDIEEDEGLSSRELIEWTESFVSEIKKLTGKDTMIYTYPTFWRDKMNNTTKFNDLPLWIAEYNNKTSPSELPGGWDKWTFWQYTDKESVSGVNKPVSGSIFNGSYEDLVKMYQ